MTRLLRSLRSHEKKNPISESSTSSGIAQRRGKRGRYPTYRNSNKNNKKKKWGSMSMWSVYLIISTRLPKTYVGVTTDFTRRLRQHNGELRGGAKASSAGRPWTLACIIKGFKDRSGACEFESRWKSISCIMPRKKSDECHDSKPLLQHREAALSRVKASFDCSCLEIEWKPISS